MRVETILPLQHSCQLNHQAETLQCLFVDVSHAVIDELGRKEESQQKDLQISAFSLLQRAQPFSVDDEAVLAVETHQLGPHPQALGAGVDGVAYAKALAATEEHAIEDVAFASSVLSSDCDDVELWR